LYQIYYKIRISEKGRVKLNLKIKMVKRKFSKKVKKMARKPSKKKV